jgi:hypothetical protein
MQCSPQFGTVVDKTGALRRTQRHGGLLCKAFANVFGTDSKVQTFGFGRLLRFWTPVLPFTMKRDVGGVGGQYEALQT